MSKWNPIGLAPKDGTKILLGYEDGRVKIARWEHVVRTVNGIVVTEREGWAHDAIPILSIGNDEPILFALIPPLPVGDGTSGAAIEPRKITPTITDKSRQLPTTPKSRRKIDTVEKLTYTIAEAARALGISERSVYNRIYDGTLPRVRVGRRVLIPAAALLDMAGQSPNGDGADVEGPGV
jgi:excisionase family DNA binding protein